MKRTLILASHHTMAAGLKDTLDFVSGGAAECVALSAYMDNEPCDAAVDKVMEALDADTEAIVLTDLTAGSVNQQFMPYVGPNVFVVAGVNVVLAMELCLAPAPLTTEGIEEAIAMTGASIKLINTLAVEDGEDDE